MKTIQVKKNDTLLSYKLYTFKLKLKKNETDDLKYSNNNLFVELVPRSFTIVCDLNTNIIGSIVGMKKFTGYGLSDDANVNKNFIYINFT